MTNIPPPPSHRHVGDADEEIIPTESELVAISYSYTVLGELTAGSSYDHRVLSDDQLGGSSNGAGQWPAAAQLENRQRRYRLRLLSLPAGGQAKEVVGQHR